ncbi:MAG: pyridoxal phosphate-dependent aminotransferase [Alphaproteobacteria bacterium]|nr:pyridoxal phosphate-dependent aminotransferase [Alphaproteobacteria bacterium]
MKILISLLLMLTIVSAHTFTKVFDKNVLLPNGQNAHLDIGTMYIWANFIEKLNSNFIVALLGKPSYPVNSNIQKAGIAYWSKEVGTDKPIPYGDPKGELRYRKDVADALSIEYGVSLDVEDVLFSVGGMSGLHSIFYAVRTLNPNKKIVTTLPYYPGYTGYKLDVPLNDLLLVNILESGTITADNLKKTLYHISASEISAFLFCDPHNPMGTTPGKEEWIKVVEVLKKYPKVPIILDEAYAEMVFDQNHTSLFSLAPSTFLDRFVILRSATKGLSAAGERLSVVISKNKKIMDAITRYVLANNIHAPKSSQFIYSSALKHTHKKEYIPLAKFYQDKVRYLQNLLQEQRIPVNTPNSTFYLVVDLSKMIGKTMDSRAKKALYLAEDAMISSDVDIAFHLLFKYNLAIAPLSFFGVDPQRCLLRITCSEDKAVLKDINDRLKAMFHEN